MKIDIPLPRHSASLRTGLTQCRPPDWIAGETEKAFHVKCSPTNGIAGGVKIVFYAKALRALQDQPKTR